MPYRTLPLCVRHRTDAHGQAQYQSSSRYCRASPLDFGGCIQAVFATAVSVDFRLRLLEKAVELRDGGQIVRAQQLVAVANWLRERIEAIEQQGPHQRFGPRATPSSSTSREDQNWMRLNRAAGVSLSSMAGSGKSEPRPREAALGPQGG